MKLEDHAARAWQVLVAAALNRQSLTYELLNDRVKFMTPGLGNVLGFVMNYCAHHHLPPLHVLVEQKHSGRPGPGLLTTNDLDADRERVYQYPWQDWPAPRAAELLPFAPTSARADG